MDVVCANQSGIVRVLYELIHDGGKRFPVGKRKFRGYAVNGNNVIRNCPTVRTDDVGFHLFAAHPCNLNYVWIIGKVNIPFRGAIGNTGRFRIEKQNVFYRHIVSHLWLSGINHGPVPVGLVSIQRAVCNVFPLLQRVLELGNGKIPTVAGNRVIHEIVFIDLSHIGFVLNGPWVINVNGKVFGGILLQPFQEIGHLVLAQLAGKYHRLHFGRSTGRVFFH